MSAFATQIEARLRRPLQPEEIFQVQKEREERLSRLLMLYIGTGLAFMLLPGTFLGVWNLIAISGRHAALSVSPTWIQAHGHAQIFGWIGTFILGIGFYSIPKLRHREPFAVAVCFTAWALWTLGVALRWLANVYLWHWRLLLPGSALLEAAAFALFFHSVAGHKPAGPGSPTRAGVARVGVEGPQRGKAPFESWILVVIAGTLGFMGMVAANAGVAVDLALFGSSPAFPHSFDQRYLALSAWGFMVPFVWGFSAKWLPVFLGLKPLRPRLLLAATAANLLAVTAALCGIIVVSAGLLLAAALLSGVALRLFASSERPAKINFVASRYPRFIRIAYVWLVVAAALGIWAAVSDSAGVWGASRHALTVGFVATMVFAVGPRVLPAFCGMRLLFSARLMGAALWLLTLGCFLRVSSEVLAYQNYWLTAWRWLPVSAVTELSAVTLFALNLLCTFALRPAPQRARAA